MKLAIVIATYYRSDRSTINVLVSALKSVLKQTYSNYKIFLIGDQYERIKISCIIITYLLQKKEIIILIKTLCGVMAELTQ